MKVAVLGTGRMGGALAGRLANLGHDVILGSREPDADKVRSLLDSIAGNVSAAPLADAAQKADWAVVAVPYSAFATLLDAVGSLDGKVVVDASNALVMGSHGLMQLDSGPSAGESLQSALPTAKVVKAFNTVGFHAVANPSVVSGPVTVMLAGDDEAAKSAVAELVEDLGFESLDVGPIQHARYLEGMSALYLTPYLQGRPQDAFEFYLRTGSSPTESKGVRAAG